MLYSIQTYISIYKIFLEINFQRKKIERKMGIIIFPFCLISKQFNEGKKHYKTFSGKVTFSINVVCNT